MDKEKRIQAELEDNRTFSQIFLRQTPGMRMIKTSLALIMCVFVHWLFPHVIDATNATIAAIVCLQQNIHTTWKTSLNRAIGTTMAGVYAYLVILAASLAGLDPNSLGSLILIAVLVVPLMQVLVTLKKPGAVAIAAIVFMIITLNPENRHEPLSFTLYRVIDTFVGISAAVFMDWLPPLNRLGERLERLKKRAEES